ncbi:MAG: formate dehydrogenase accessory sulfurtransferase FdhD, partial [Gemmobacter sp.]
MTAGAHLAPGGPAGARGLAEEVAVAVSYNGMTQAVMMATPADLEDFARGFTLTEGIADPAAIAGIEPVSVPEGIDLRIWLRPDAAARLAERRRSMAGPVGCGLCGLESLAEAMRPVLPVTAVLTMTAAEVMAAMAALPAHQPLHDATRAAHCAALFVPRRGIVLAREDVGRHNALDKLAGGLIAAGIAAGQGALVVTSRVSVDLVQKAGRMGAPVLIAASA